ncbi:glycosyltransferase [Novosphingobium sp. ERN07]|uniref:glycosyltransferase family 2 protein n=1 Tax=Novosphingobium sp. ERN07 TaxID=2726187 RepID=UPI001457799F|nr:glycosyltransferase family 2 protein [Novosphingobium sp. ERN07]NLR73271.1 glycosyltransferase [Novosphingobium sp. ERN07]
MNGLRLKIVAHLNAARSKPAGWLLAMWWLVLGKRLRAKTKLAALLGSTPQAYELWLLAEPRPPLDESGNAAIIALVDAGQGEASTLQSARTQGMPAFLVRDGVLDEVIDQIDWALRPWIMPMTAGDSLSSDAVAAYRFAISQSGSRIIYADDDLIDMRGRRHSPHFKPAWNAELHRHFDYVSGACVVQSSADVLRRIAGPGWMSRLTAAVTTEADAKPVRLPHILHHRRDRTMPVVPRRMSDASDNTPKVTVIVPTRNRLDLLATCIAGLERTNYADFEVIIVDNGSDDPATLAWLAKLDRSRYRILRDDGGFNFSRLNNRAVEIADGEVLCLLNNDVEMIRPDWLSIMVRQAVRPEVGAVGAQLLYSDGRIQHAGVVIGICGGAAHAHRLLWPDDQGYFSRHALPQFVSAVTAACLVVRRSSYQAVGGLDEERFAVAFNDVDFCLRLNARGWQSLYEPRARLIHHESVSRGFDRDPAGALRFAGELDALKTQWGTDDFDADVDPFHHPQLSRYSEIFALRAGE